MTTSTNGRRRTVNYEAVARVYLAAAAKNKPPTKAVAARFRLKYANAAQRVMRARQLGLIPAAKDGTARGLSYTEHCPACGAAIAHWNPKRRRNGV
jgi:hypothetical protein